MKLAKTYPIRLVCRLLGVPRSSIYYAPQPASFDEAMLKSALLDLAGEWPTYGYRRLTAMMRHLDWPRECQTGAALDERAGHSRRQAHAQDAHH